MSTVLAMVLATVAADPLHELDEANWDRALRTTPWALVLFHASWAHRSQAVLAELRRVAELFRDRGLLFGSVRADGNKELLDRFDITSYPALLWFDGSPKWPYYASEARPHRYDGDRTFDAIATFVEQRSGQLRSRPHAAGPQSSPPESSERDTEKQSAAVSPSPDAPPTTVEPASATSTHACSQLSQEYVECMHVARHGTAAMCSAQRRKYVLCMSAKWTVHPDRHRALAEEYGRRFAS